MKPACDALLLALREPAAMADFSDATWDRVIRQAASAGLLGRLAALAQEAGVQASFPRAVQEHMQAVSILATQQHRAVRWELVQLSRTLADLEGPVLLLKGAAYAAAGLAPAAGRLFADIDLLVPKAQLDAAEAALMLGGWVSDSRDPYDERYYRQWMHELPPMTHIARQTTLDLHHDILPDTARIRPRTGLIIGAARPLPEFGRFSIPEPADLVLHSATHLFHEGEWQHGLRDLVDLDALLRSFGRDPAFWDALVERANSVGLGRPLFYGLRYTRRLLATPVPAGVIERCAGRPGKLMAAAMDVLFLNAFASAHPSCETALTGLAAWSLYVRSHWLRMPLPLLLPHLVRKAWMQQREKFSTPPPADAKEATRGE